MRQHLLLLVFLVTTTGGCQLGKKEIESPFQPAIQPYAADIRQVKPGDGIRQAGFTGEPGDTVDQAAPDSSLSTGNPPGLEELENRVLESSPAISEAEAKLEALRGKLVQAGLPPNPTAGVNGEDINEGGGAGRYGVYFGRKIVRGGKLELAQSVVAAEINVAEQQLELVRQKSLTDVRQEFFAILVAQERIKRIDSLVELTKRAVDISSRLVVAKETPRTSLLQAEMEFENSLVLAKRAQNQLVRAKRRMAALIGEDRLPFDSVQADFKSMVKATTFENSLDELLASSPELTTLVAEIEKERRNLARQQVQPVPDVTWQTTVQFDSVTDDVVTGFQVGMPIPCYDRNQGAISNARKKMLAAERRVEKKTNDLRQRLATVFQEYRDAKIQVEAFENRLLPKAKETLQLITLGYEQGEVQFLPWLTAQRTYSQTQQNYLDQIQLLCQNYWQLRGLLLDSSLSDQVSR